MALDGVGPSDPGEELLALHRRRQLAARQRCRAQRAQFTAKVLRACEMLRAPHVPQPPDVSLALQKRLDPRLLRAHASAMPGLIQEISQLTAPSVCLPPLGTQRRNIEAKDCRVRHPNITALKVSVDREWMTMNTDYVVKACKIFRRRLETVIAADGGYIE
ncbi:hypothetical protein FHG87_006842 [Trinorchestia longiramus]|nr:hypothetical protein FHG87_006842 [Trinorchestia longiramus]